MAQISNSNLQSICDKMARHAAEANGSPLASAITTGGAYATTIPTSGGLLVANADVIAALAALVTGFTDPDQQSDFIPPAVGLEESTPLLNQFLFSFWANMRRALDNHMARYNAMQPGDLTPLDAGLRLINVSTALRLSGIFNQYFGGISPAYVFTPTPFVLATIGVLSATTLTFTHVASMSGVYGPGQIALLNTQLNTGTTAVITLTAVNFGGLIANPTVTDPPVTDQEITAASDTNKVYVDCTGATITGGTSGDQYAVVILPDRLINAA